MGLHNQFLLGASYDHGRVGYASSSDLGTFGPEFVLTPFDPTFLILSPDDSQPRNLTTQNDYIGVYFSDTLDLTPQARADGRRTLQFRAPRDPRQYRQFSRG